MYKVLQQCIPLTNDCCSWVQSYFATCLDKGYREPRTMGMNTDTEKGDNEPTDPKGLLVRCIDVSISRLSISRIFWTTLTGFFYIFVRTQCTSSVHALSPYRFLSVYLVEVVFSKLHYPLFLLSSDGNLLADLELCGIGGLPRGISPESQDKTYSYK